MARAQAPSLPWHARSVAETVADASTSLDRGLSLAEAAKRLERFGPNRTSVIKDEPWWEEAIEALTEPLILLLIAVAVLYALLGELSDAVTILAVILAVAGVEVANETRAKRAIVSLRSLSAPTATVVRDGQVVDLSTFDVVPGDLVLIRPGERVAADLRLIETVALRVDESALTGESVSAVKNADAVLDADAELGERRTMAFAGTLVQAGKGRGIVVATGRSTELGRIARLAEAVREPRTPLQRNLRQLAGWLLWLAVAFSVLVPLLGVLVARLPLQTMLLTGLTLAFATIPEELPILVTIVLGLGSWQLARRRAIAKRLQAAETLGSVSVVGTDKTGTLTENRMRAVDVFADDRFETAAAGGPSETVERLLEIAVLANDAQINCSDGRRSFVGEPMETALLAAAEDAGLDALHVRAATRVLEESPFDHTRRRMSVVYERAGECWIAVKGAPETVQAISAQILIGGKAESLDAARRKHLQSVADQMAARGLRVLAFAERRLATDEETRAASAEANLTFVGLIGIEDPPRPEVPSAIATLQAAGVGILMLTGDHPATALAIAERVGIDARGLVVGRDLDRLTDAELRRLIGTVSVFARIAPEHKLRIVQALRREGQVIAVTGDGVNDVPALREADIGIAMGRTGTDIAREAADLVLADDNFATVVEAVRTGRTLYANLWKAVRYYLAVKVALVTSSLVAVLALLSVPFGPVQIIVLELFMDLGASTTFVAEPPEENVMSRPPRDPREPFMSRAMQLGILGGGISLAAAVLVAYFWAQSSGLGIAGVQTTAFATWMVGHVVLAAHMRAEWQPLRWANLRANRPFLLWSVAAITLPIAGTAWPFLGERLHLVTLPAGAWAIALAAGLIVPSWWEAAKRVCQSRAGWR